MSDLAVLHIFLDMHGVLVEHGNFSRMYRDTMIRLMQERYGGSADVWQFAHDQAGKRWFRSINEAMAQPNRQTYDQIYTALQGEWATWILDIARQRGIRTPMLSKAEAYRLGNDLGYLIPANFQGVPPQNAATVLSLAAPPFAGRVRLYVATNAHSQHAYGILDSAGLRDCFHGMCTPDTLDCFYKNRLYWEQAFAYAGAQPHDCLVADDEERKGITDPHVLGARTVLVNERRSREGNPADEHDPDVAIRTPRQSVADYRISSLAELPTLVEGLLK